MIKKSRKSHVLLPLAAGVIVAISAAAASVIFWPADDSFHQVRISSLYCQKFAEICQWVEDEGLRQHELRDKFSQSLEWPRGRGISQQNHQWLLELAALRDRPTAKILKEVVDEMDHGLLGTQMGLWAISHIERDAAIPFLIDKVREGGHVGRSAHSCLERLSIRGADYLPDSPEKVADNWDRWYEAEGQQTSFTDRLEIRLREGGGDFSGPIADNDMAIIQAVQKYPLGWDSGEKTGFLRDRRMSDNVLIAMALSEHLCEWTDHYNISPAGFPMNSPDRSWCSVGSQRRWIDWVEILEADQQ